MPIWSVREIEAHLNMELLAIISLSSITWILFRFAPKNYQTGNQPRYLWICYSLPFVGSAALYGCLHSAILLLVTRGLEPVAFWLYPILIRSFNLTYIPITVLCAASCLVQLYYIVLVQPAPTMSRVWLSWNLIVTTTLTAALAFKYHW